MSMSVTTPTGPMEVPDSNLRANSQQPSTANRPGRNAGGGSDRSEWSRGGIGAGYSLRASVTEPGEAAQLANTIAASMMQQHSGAFATQANSSPQAVLTLLHG
jgi:hypothetical protein